MRWVRKVSSTTNADSARAAPQSPREKAQTSSQGRVDRDSGPGRSDRIEGLVFDFDGGGGISGAVLGIGHDHRQHVSDVPSGLALRHQQRPVVDDQAVVADAGDVLGGDDALDPRHLGGLRCLDPRHPGAGVVGEDEGPVQHAIDRHVGDEILGAEGLVATSVAVARGADAVVHRLVRISFEAVVLTEVVRPPWGTFYTFQPLPMCLTRRLNRIHDTVVAGAAAEVTGEPALDSRPVSGQAFVDEVGRPHRDARGTESALHRALTNEGVRQQLALAVWETLEGEDLGTSDL
jgi:hypothetical protein